MNLKGSPLSVCEACVTWVLRCFLVVLGGSGFTVVWPGHSRSTTFIDSLSFRFLCFVESDISGLRVLLLSLKCWYVSALVCYCLGFYYPLWVLGSGDIVLSTGLANHGHIFVNKPNL